MLINIVQAVCETPKWSFVKYKRQGKGYVRDLWSPLPTLFNYGFVKGEKGGDGDPQDAIILGERISQGDEVDMPCRGKVVFFDAGLVDDKIVLSDKALTGWDVIVIRLFFISYAL